MLRFGTLLDGAVHGGDVGRGGDSGWARSLGIDQCLEAVGELGHVVVVAF